MTPERFAKIQTVLAARQPDLTLLLDDVHKSHNVAAVLRSCDAAGVFEAHAVARDGKLLRHHMISGGSRKWVNLNLHTEMTSACAALKATGHQILAAHFSDKAVDYRLLDYTGPTAFLLGSELMGVDDDAANAADGHVVIPMTGHVSSLNVSVAAALLLFEAKRQREAAGLYTSTRLPTDQYRKVLFEWSHPDIARRCRELDLPYPAMTKDGDLAENPFEGQIDGGNSYPK